MNPLSINAEGLWSQALQYLCPHHAEKTNSILNVFGSLTDKKSLGAKQFSGYRYRILERLDVEASKILASELRQEFDSMIVLGIGGSALGARTAINALTWSVPLPDRKKVYIADNLDPIEFEDIWAECEPAKTVVVIISKSGGTIETMAQASTLIERLTVAELPIEKHVVTVTDPKSGALRNWTMSAGLKSLEVPPEVGGRFSVLTAVGLLPIAFAGISIDELVDGAAQFLGQKYLDSQFVARMALRFAELEHGGFTAHALMPYSTKLKDFGAWFVQLWGESLGKTKAGRGSCGMIPIAAVGATDQHSLLQLLVEGPNRLAVGFIRVEDWPQTANKKATMGKLPVEFSQLSFAYSKTFEEIMNAEQRATKLVLEQKQRPVYEISLANPAPTGLGALFAFYMDLVSMTGAALEVNPYDQPGVELGKKILPSLLQS